MAFPDLIFSAILLFDKEIFFYSAFQRQSGRRRRNTVTDFLLSLSEEKNYITANMPNISEHKISMAVCCQ